MKNRILALCLITLALAAPLCACSAPAASVQTDAAEETTAEPTEEITMEEQEENVKKAYNPTDMKAMWISQFDLASVYCKGGSQREEGEFTKLIRKILDNVVSCNINTVIIQMRPYADSMYPSEVYPPSYIVTGSYANDFKYDAIEIFIREAHERNLSVQAWINPMRAMKVTEIEKVSDKYLIKQWYDDKEKQERLLPIVGDRVYLNAMEPAVRELIVSGAKEILQRYDVDGLHMDDYFYPTTDGSFDSITYTEYRAGGGKVNLTNLRKNVLSELVQELYKVTKESGEGRIFGISPAGDINTVVNSQYADVRKWCKYEGYIDYICPQVYFGLEHDKFDFKSVCATWQSIIKTDKVKLIVGMTLGKAKSGVDQYAVNGKYEWTENKDVLLRCLEHTKTLPKCSGVSYFCYQYFFDPVSGAQDHSTKAERDNFIPLLGEITWQQE